VSQSGSWMSSTCKGWQTPAAPGEGSDSRGDACAWTDVRVAAGNEVGTVTGDVRLIAPLHLPVSAVPLAFAGRTSRGKRLFSCVAMVCAHCGRGDPPGTDEPGLPAVALGTLVPLACLPTCCSAGSPLDVVDSVAGPSGRLGKDGVL
jgi:hypothetical protein